MYIEILYFLYFLNFTYIIHAYANEYNQENLNWHLEKPKPFGEYQCK